MKSESGVLINQSPVTGRIKSAATINREIRRALNAHGAIIAEKLLEHALGGDVNALIACANLMLAANAQISE